MEVEQARGEVARAVAAFERLLVLTTMSYADIVDLAQVIEAWSQVSYDTDRNTDFRKPFCQDAQLRAGRQRAGRAVG